VCALVAPGACCWLRACSMSCTVHCTSEGRATGLPGREQHSCMWYAWCRIVVLICVQPGTDFAAACWQSQAIGRLAVFLQPCHGVYVATSAVRRCIRGAVQLVQGWVRMLNVTYIEQCGVWPRMGAGGVLVHSCLLCVTNNMEMIAHSRHACCICKHTEAYCKPLLLSRCSFL